jgi:hypothetical protein
MIFSTFATEYHLSEKMGHNKIRVSQARDKLMFYVTDITANE